MSTATLKQRSLSGVPSLDERVAVLGTGPAALVVALAAEMANLTPTFFGRIQKSPIYGCQYMHKQLPYFPVKQADVEYRLIGTAEGYRDRVYGIAWDGAVSPEDLAGEHTAWDIRQTYDLLWDRYAHGYEMYHWEVNPQSARESERILLDNYKYVVSTVPATALCSNQSHTFRTIQIWAWGESPAEKPYITVPENTIICDGRFEEEHFNSWYRASRVFGKTTIEWPITVEQPHSAKRVYKPLATDCNCIPGIVRMGRYGAWDKSILVHNVYDQATELFDAGRADTRMHQTS